MKKNKGITLIALVISIIVLLILAGVSITMLTGDNSILKNASKTPDYNAISTAKDRISIKVLEYTSEYFSEYYTNEIYIGQEMDASNAVNAAIDDLKANLGMSNITLTGNYTDGLRVEASEYYTIARFDIKGNMTWDPIEKINY